ncbi:hypothetical protein ACFCXR_37895 [Streptomyces noursei]|uniref:hypothetical protein n=1 Tax=Streptomyces TaxID=1883 RepID=UPI00045EF83F|nr:hypothetical protein [Streptomyces noursei]AIA03475.1 hypothetical protein DC74_2975 [Streptomyces noursei]
MDINSALKVLEGLHKELTELKKMRDKESGGEWSDAVSIRIILDDVTEDSAPKVIEGQGLNVWVTAEDEDGELPRRVLEEDGELKWSYEMARIELAG